MITSLAYNNLFGRIVLTIRAGGRAIVAVLLVSFTSMLGGCYDSYNVAELRTDRDVIINSIERYQEESKLIQIRIAKLEKDSAVTVEVQEGIKAAQAERRIKEKEIDKYEEDLRLAVELLKAYLNSFVVKIDLEPGAKFAAIRLKNGKELKNAVFKSFTPELIKFSHSGGVGSYPVDLMPDMVAKYLMLPPEKPAAVVDPLAILARRPEILMTNDQIRKKRNNDYEAKVASEELKAQQREDLMLADRKKREGAAEDAAEDAAEAEKMKATKILAAEAKQRAAELKLEQQRGVLRAELNKYNSAYFELQRAYDQKVSAINNSKIRPSAADRKKLLGGYSEKGKVLKRKIAEIEAQIAALK